MYGVIEAIMHAIAHRSPPPLRDLDPINCYFRDAVNTLDLDGVCCVCMCMPASQLNCRIKINCTRRGEGEKWAGHASTGNARTRTHWKLNWSNPRDRKMASKIETAQLCERDIGDTSATHRAICQCAGNVHMEIII